MTNNKLFFPRAWHYAFEAQKYLVPLQALERDGEISVISMINKQTLFTTFSPAAKLREHPLLDRSVNTISNSDANHSRERLVIYKIN